MDDAVQSISYIKTELIPGMVERQELTIDGAHDNDGAAVRLESVEAWPLQADGTFMLTNLFKAKVVFSNRNSPDVRQEHRLVIKITPAVTEEIYISCQFDTLFENEALAYTDIIPALGKSELYPKYFYSHRKPFNAVMVLSDFSVDGWKMAPMVVNLPLEYCLLAAQELGRFHGECYALKEQKRDLFENIINKFKESRYGADMQSLKWMEVMRTVPKRLVKAVRESIFKDLIPEEYLQKLVLALDDMWNKLKLAVQPKEPLAVICHGDFLRNNMAFKYCDKTNPDKPTHVMMFDFQTLRYASPMIDFAVFIAVSTGYDVRKKHFETIFRTYHDKLVETLCCVTQTNPVDLPKHYSYESFQREFATYYTYGFKIASSFLMILYEPVDNVMAMESMTVEETIADSMRRGGPALDRELVAMVYEMYKMHTRYNMDPE
ncbi:uncharacterized protein LOC129777856 [Toxorhynchites rutilus septentrionalis]|uniref:uncharacterized protein LOC129777856 n=1 Tax=Toxorhynchites rutilus septentrionalis TaxID=329112 RepID=UPI002478C765|nr:uncharacterized protein LOC129777856 [Toxorhynchites rutilus septentrionalis]